MNDEARDVLVAAWTRGHRQVSRMFHDLGSHEGDCALGVLHVHMHKGQRSAAIKCGQFDHAVARFDLQPGEVGEIIRRNDAGQDFLTIARKVGIAEEA